MKRNDLIEILETIAPPHMAEDFDAGRIGLILDMADDINTIGVSLDASHDVFMTAAKAGVDMLITHHTPIFRPLTKISKNFATTLSIALENNISLYTMHTNYDAVDDGVNDVLAELLGLSNIRKIKDESIGRIGTIEKTSMQQFAQLVSEKLDTPVRYVGDHDIETVMVIGGSGLGDEYIDLAIKEGADVLVSGEMRHSASLRGNELSLIDATHYATENPAMKRLYERLGKILHADGVDAEIIFIDSNPAVVSIA